MGFAICNLKIRSQDNQYFPSENLILNPEAFINTCMAENQIIITGTLSNTDLREAAGNLAETNRKIAETHTLLLSDTNWDNVTPLSLDIVLRTTFGPRNISEKLKRQRRTEQTWLTRMLVTAGTISYPEVTDRKISERMHGFSTFPSKLEARGYSRLLEQVQYMLASQYKNYDLNAIHYAFQAYAADLVVRKMHQGVFLYSPHWV